MSQGMDKGRGEEKELFLQPAVVVFYKSQLWDRDSCMSDSIWQCSQGAIGRKRRNTLGCDQAKWQPQADPAGRLRGKLLLIGVWFLKNWSIFFFFFLIY